MAISTPPETMHKTCTTPTSKHAECRSAQPSCKEHGGAVKKSRHHPAARKVALSKRLSMSGGGNRVKRDMRVHVSATIYHRLQQPGILVPLPATAHTATPTQHDLVVRGSSYSERRSPCPRFCLGMLCFALEEGWSLNTEQLQSRAVQAGPKFAHT